MKPIPFSTYLGYQWFSRYWWREIIFYATGLYIPHFVHDGDRRAQWLVPGWCKDIYTFYHRGRYGWAPRDVWNMDNYLNHVIGHMLHHLAETSNGAPAGYPDPSTTAHETNHEQWGADVRSWSQAFLDLQSWNDHGEMEAYTNGIDAHTRTKLTREKYEAVERALTAMAPWWGGLWN